jgi:hypothetical protein
MMEYEADVIWRKGDGEMPPDVKHVVDAARSELLLRTLNLPPDVANEIRYNAYKKSQTVSNYITSVLVSSVAT